LNEINYKCNAKGKIEMSVLTIENLSHAFGDKVLYKNAALTLNRGEHVGLVGLNGVGKSTLMNIVTGLIIPDVGEINWLPKIKVGHLDQHAEIDREMTVQAYLQTAFADLYALQDQLDEVNAQMENSTDGHLELLKKADRLQNELERDGFVQIPGKIGRVAKGLGITAFGVDRTIGTLSGGQRAKVVMAKLLLEQPDVLLLDEPTNFLDVAHIDWLAKFLKDYSGTFLMISHDAEFLKRTVNIIYDIEFLTITRYKGGYEFFLSQKGERREQYIRDFQSQQKLIEKTEDYIRRNKVRASTAKMAQSRQKMLDKIDRLDAPKNVAKPTFSFAFKDIVTETVLETTNLEIGYYYPLLPKINVTVKRGEHLAITGCNGIGKSTLLKTVTNRIPALGGSYKLGEQVIVGYFEQDTTWESDNLTPLQYITELYPKMSRKEVLSALARCGVRAEHQLQALPTLSGGEQAKVKLCGLTLFSCSLLILDEPTSHLDTDAKEAFQNALKKYPGTVILVSHEESFYQKYADQVLDVEQMM